MLNSDTIKELQNISFGKRYEDACMSKTNLNESINKRLLKWMNNPKGFLILSSEVGRGKTFLCSSLLNFFLTRQSEICPNRMPFSMGYTETNFFRRLKCNFGNDYSDKVLPLLNYHMVILDDFGSSNITEWRKEVLFDVINTRYESMKPTIITTNLLEKDIIDAYGHRIADRLFSSDNTIIKLNSIDNKR